ncbi:hypothetical protein PIL02S_01878 [Paenibacillus illinoisensis]|uniref:Uncharacterized protein n=1 Tax=Paenibacillus illinoisensis TaxID=59845 RepID=A0A2W0CPU5_9BACL|nr:hypothetical protein PIL02S_01878 [Paenibacillus illinoisensis]
MVSDAEASLAQLDIARMALGCSSLAKKGSMKINKLGSKSDHKREKKELRKTT